MQDQTTIAVSIAIACLVMFSFALGLILISIVYQRKMLHKETKIQLLEKSRHIAIFKAASEAEEKEKERIFRNLHDEINPLLAALKQNLQKHRFLIQRNEFDVSRFNTDYEIIDRVVEGVRTSAYELVPSFLNKYGLAAALSDHMASVNAGGKIEGQFSNTSIYRVQSPLSPQQNINTYRMSLEIINNIIKHGGCKMLRLNCASAQGFLMLEFSHDGRVVTNDYIHQMTLAGKGTGLSSIRARAMLLNASLDYAANQANEATILLKIPVNEQT